MDTQHCRKLSIHGVPEVPWKNHKKVETEIRKNNLLRSGDLMIYGKHVAWNPALFCCAAARVSPRLLCALHALFLVCTCIFFCGDLNNTHENRALHGIIHNWTLSDASRFSLSGPSRCSALPRCTYFRLHKIETVKTLVRQIGCRTWCRHVRTLDEMSANPALSAGVPMLWLLLPPVVATSRL